ncbi:hypothetical protein PAECIP111892_05237 [Paenibacillus auburnensis]|uniref:GmrSD restriction endonucleases N-terminal domain-containing protein n=1 Tax=Paenibacillus auburnensis TaxID=2905649 RepID=A0ABM9CTF3_9BACL|nr:DUF262 domain-containing protein [Paenibacillus auburnensis]CAH1222922.1 hypothetical protein PAECIP111892_05237 [Paenibacillus auburnensis]
MNWNSSSHPISDIRDWNTLRRLEIRPDFQRGEVWTNAAKIMLMDSILHNIPMPKVFFQSVVRELDTYRIVIDGQQRLNAILSFLSDEFKLESPYKGEYEGLKFSDLPEPVKRQFLSYKVDINEIIDATEELVREIYSRVNKYTIALNKQELRRADFPGDFLRLSEDLALIDFFEESKVFSVANRRRMGDVEFVSELLVLLIDGVQDKKEKLDSFYDKFSIWENKHQIEDQFNRIIGDIKSLFSKEHISLTRFKQKADFYSLFAAINDLQIEGRTLIGKDLNSLQEDFAMLDDLIVPESQVSIFSEYAIKCVSQGNSHSSREWRKKLLGIFLHGTYKNTVPDSETREIFHNVILDIEYGGFCPPAVQSCPICLEEYDDYSKENVFLTWSINESNFQLSNSLMVHYNCKENCKEFYTFDEGHGLYEGYDLFVPGPQE